MMLLPKRLALPIFASDALSSVAYATQEILLVLAFGGTAYLFLTPWVATAVIVLMIAVVASYRQLVRAYPTGGGDYEVASRNIGRRAGVVVASALLVDYVMTVAVSVSAGVDNIISAIPSLHGTACGWRSVSSCCSPRSTCAASARPACVRRTYLPVRGRRVHHDRHRPGPGRSRRRAGRRERALRASSRTRLRITRVPSAVLLALRAFSSGCTALTGVEAIANGVPAFRPPKARNAQITLAMMGAIAITMFAGITALALISDVHIADNAVRPGRLRRLPARPQRTVIAQVAAAGVRRRRTPSASSTSRRPPR